MYELGGPLGTHEVPPGTNLLVSGPPLSGKTALGYTLLEHGARQDEGNILVSNTTSVERVRTDTPGLFAHDTPVGIVDCITKHQGHGTLADTDLVQYASSPDDMTGIGIKSSRLLGEFYGERGLTRNRVLFVSVSTLLHYSDVQTVFRFLHVFTSRIESADALGLFVIEVGAHDEKTMNTISQLFDGLLEVAADGSVTPRLP